MPDQPDKYDFTETDMDLIVVELTGKPVRPDSAAAGITSMRQRMAQLESAKAKVLDQLDTAAGKLEADLNADLAKLNKDLATTHERLSHYEKQISQQN